MKFLQKKEDYTKSGSKGGKLPDCKCFEQLLFLKDTISNKAKTSSNITVTPNTVPLTPAATDSFITSNSFVDDEHDDFSSEMGSFSKHSKKKR